MLPGDVALVFIAILFGHWWAFAVALLFGPGSGPRAVAWAAVFSCSLGMLLYNARNFTLLSLFHGVVGLSCFVGLFFSSLPSWELLVCYCLGLALGLGVG